MKEDDYVENILRRAESGDVEALYEKGKLYDLGEHVPLDKLRASKIFKQAADSGHPHSAWIHSSELLWGLGSFQQSITNGLLYLSKAIKGGSGEACMTKARLYLFGELGHEKNEIESLRFRKLALKLDNTICDVLANQTYVERIRQNLSQDDQQA